MNDATPLLRDARLLRLGRRLTRPAAAFAVFNLVLVAWHLPPLYNLAMEQHPVHIVEHLMIMAASVILWWPVLSPLPELPRAAYPIQLLYLFVVGLPLLRGRPACLGAADTPRRPASGRSHHVDSGRARLSGGHLGGVLPLAGGRCRR